MPIIYNMRKVGGGYKKVSKSYRMRGPSHSASMYRAGLVPGGKHKRPSKTLREQVNRIVEGKQETKFVLDAPWNFDSNISLETFTGFTSGITSTAEVYALIPKIQQGTDDHNRIGQQIQPVSLTTKVNLALYTQHSQNVYVDVFFCHSRTVKSANNTSSVVVSKLLNAGDGTNVGYDGTSFTSMLPINKTEFTVIARRRIKLEKVGGNPNYELDTSLGTSSISPSRYCASFSQKIKLPNRLVYEQSSSQAPSNVFPFMMIGFCGADAMGGIAPISARVQAQAQSHLYYKDA